ncbi:MAG: hypothetical protein VYC34_00945, partial [Planctomycetota bacterium]|nr:hypothetical protein [Planctomycetota bacterium]
MRAEIESPTPLDFLSTEPAVRAIATELTEGRRTAVIGAQGSSTSLLVAAVAQLAKRPALLCVAHLDEADETVDELTSMGVRARRLCAVELLPGETKVSLELFAERLGLLRAILDHPLEPGEVI